MRSLRIFFSDDTQVNFKRNYFLERFFFLDFSHSHFFSSFYILSIFLFILLRFYFVDRMAFDHYVLESKSTILKEQEVPLYDPSLYGSKYIKAMSRDGTLHISFQKISLIKFFFIYSENTRIQKNIREKSDSLTFISFFIKFLFPL